MIKQTVKNYKIINLFMNNVSTHIIIISHNCMYPYFIIVCVIIFDILNEYYFK